jgi:hypothetical protein
MEPCKPPVRLNSTTTGSVFQLLNGRYVDICLPFKAGWTLWHQLLLRHLNAAFERHKQNPFYHSPVVPRYVSHEGRTICNLSRLIIVRNPHERLLSYYLDKVKASCNVQGVQHCPKTTYWPSALPPKASFAETIAAINHSISSRLMRTYFGHLHYAPISEAYTERGHPCGGDTLRRQIRDGSRRVLKLEEMEHWYPPLVRELGLEAAVATGWDRLTSRQCFYELPDQNCSATNHTLYLHPTAAVAISTSVNAKTKGAGTAGHNKDASGHMQHYYTPELVQFVTQYARSDIELFGYPDTPLQLSP